MNIARLHHWLSDQSEMNEWLTADTKESQAFLDCALVTKRQELIVTKKTNHVLKLALPKCQNLKKLKLWYLDCGHITSANLINFSKFSANLTYLDFNGVWIDPGCFAALVEFPSIKTIAIRWCREYWPKIEESEKAKIFHDFKCAFNVWKNLEELKIWIGDIKFFLHILHILPNSLKRFQFMSTKYEMDASKCLNVCNEIENFFGIRTNVGKFANFSVDLEFKHFGKILEVYCPNIEELQMNSDWSTPFDLSKFKNLKVLHIWFYAGQSIDRNHMLNFFQTIATTSQVKKITVCFRSGCTSNEYFDYSKKLNFVQHLVINLNWVNDLFLHRLLFMLPLLKILSITNLHFKGLADYHMRIIGNACPLLTCLKLKGAKLPNNALDDLNLINILVEVLWSMKSRPQNLPLTVLVYWSKQDDKKYIKNFHNYFSIYPVNIVNNAKYW